MSFHGFDTAQIRVMAARMTKISPEARSLHAELGRVLTEAELHLGGKPATTSSLLQPLVGQILPLLTHGLPGSLDGELTDTAGSINRRCAQLDAVQKLDGQGYEIDPGLDFDDEKPPDPKKIDDAVAYFDAHIGDSVPGTGANSVYDQFAALTPAELDAVMYRMTPDQLAKLNTALGPGPTYTGMGPQENWAKAKWANLLMSELGPQTLLLTEASLPNLDFQPDPGSEHVKDAKYGDVKGRLFRPDGADVKQDIEQGQDGDCWFLAGLGAITLQDPDFPKQHIKQNPNGTYTVSLVYHDPNDPGAPGVPTEVTVDGKLPVDSAGNTVYTHTPGDVLWPAIYEKAYAQLYGGYGPIEGGFGNRSMADIAGVPTQKASRGSMSLDDIDRQLKQGHAVTLGTNEDAEAHDDRIPSAHELMVERVNTNVHPPTITVLNPWGASGSVPPELTLTEAEYEREFREVAYTKTAV